MEGGVRSKVVAVVARSTVAPIAAARTELGLVALATTALTADSTVTASAAELISMVTRRVTEPLTIVMLIAERSTPSTCAMPKMVAVSL